MSSKASQGPTPETFYGLTEKPFGDAPDIRFLYRSSAFERASQELTSAIARREGIVVLTGAAGIGKTTLCRSVVSELDRRTMTSLASRRIWNLDDLLRTVLVDFGVVSSEDLARRRAEREELATTLKGFLASLGSLQASAVLVIDDAHALEVAVLEEIGVLAEAAAGRRLQIVLAGDHDLLAAVDEYKLRELARRITSRLELAPLAADEVRGYVAHRLAVAGPSVRVEFDAAACERLFEFSNGNPKIVNMLCDRALTLGFQSSASTIGDGMVVDAAEYLNLRTTPAVERWLPTALIAVSIVASMIVGASAAAWVLRDRLMRTVAQWQSIPRTAAPPISGMPVPPIRLMPVPLSAVPAPAGESPEPQR